MVAATCVCIYVCICVYVCACVWPNLHCMNGTATLLNLIYNYKYLTKFILQLFIHGLYYCVHFVNALYDWNITKTIPGHI